MAFKVFNVTIGASATQLKAAVAGHTTPFQEIQFDPAIAHDTFIGDSSVSNSNYAIKLPANGTTPRIIANGPAALAVDKIENLYVSGTQNDVLHFYAITL